MAKVALISQYGSGTNLLRSFLNSHPDIYFHKEIFCVPAGWHPSNHGKGDYAKALDKAFAYDKPIVGVDIKYNQLNPEIERYLVEHDVAIIHLLRDPMRTVWHGRDEVNAEHLRMHLNKIRSYRSKIMNMFNKIMEITYEDMTRGQEVSVLPFDVENSILSYLDARIVRLSFASQHSVKPLIVRNNAKHSQSV